MTPPEAAERAREFFGCEDPAGFVCEDNAHHRRCWHFTGTLDIPEWACESLTALLISVDRERGERDAKALGEEFCRLRFDPRFHIALGDIRLTIDMQEQIAAALSSGAGEGG